MVPTALDVICTTAVVVVVVVVVGKQTPAQHAAAQTVADKRKVDLFVVVKRKCELANFALFDFAAL